MNPPPLVGHLLGSKCYRRIIGRRLVAIRHVCPCLMPHISRPSHYHLPSSYWVSGALVLPCRARDGALRVAVRILLAFFPNLKPRSFTSGLSPSHHIRINRFLHALEPHIDSPVKTSHNYQSQWLARDQPAGLPLAAPAFPPARPQRPHSNSRPGRPPPTPRRSSPPRRKHRRPRAQGSWARWPAPQRE